MRKHILSVLFFFISLTGIHAQNRPKETYLSVKIVSNYNFTKGETYYSLAVDKGNTFAEVLYKLNPFRRKLRTEDSAYLFYTGGMVDTARTYHNYFVSESAALSFMGAINWKLVTVNSYLTASPGFPAERLYNDVYTTTSYYFKKEIE